MSTEFGSIMFQKIKMCPDDVTWHHPFDVASQYQFVELSHKSQAIMMPVHLYPDFLHNPYLCQFFTPTVSYENSLNGQLGMFGSVPVYSDGMLPAAVRSVQSKVVFISKTNEEATRLIAENIAATAAIPYNPVIEGVTKDCDGTLVVSVRVNDPKVIPVSLTTREDMPYFSLDRDGVEWNPSVQGFDGKQFVQLAKDAFYVLLPQRFVQSIISNASSAEFFVMSEDIGDIRAGRLGHIVNVPIFTDGVSPDPLAETNADPIIFVPRKTDGS